MTTSHILATSLLVCLATAAGSELAQAQPGATPPGSVPPYVPPDPYGAPPPPRNYYPPPPPRAPAASANERRGWNLGFGAGIGFMESSAGPLACAGCEVDPPTGAFDVHGGMMVNSRMAVQGEFWFQSRALDVDGTSSIRQSMLLLAAQYWITPRLWLKAGLGYASLSVSYFDGFQDRSDQLGEGLGTLAGIGYELVHSPRFGLDVQLKAGSGNYDETDEEISVGAIAIGLNWY